MAARRTGEVGAVGGVGGQRFGSGSERAAEASRQQRKRRWLVPVAVGAALLLTGSAAPGGTGSTPQPAAAPPVIGRRGPCWPQGFLHQLQTEDSAVRARDAQARAVAGALAAWTTAARAAVVPPPAPAAPPALAAAQAEDAQALLRHVLVLEYHDIVPARCARNVYEVPVQVFAQQMAELYQSGVPVVTARTLATWLRDGTPLPPHVAVLTFDDGYEGVYLYAYPILLRYHFPFSLFLIGADIRGSGPALWSGYARLTVAEVHAMLQSGLADVESHTWNLHSNVPCPYDCANQATIITDLNHEAAFLYALTGQLPAAFAYPGGRVSPVGLAMARDFYRIAFVGSRLPPLGQWLPEARWLVPRLLVTQRTNLLSVLQAQGDGWQWYRITTHLFRNKFSRSQPIPEPVERSGGGPLEPAAGLLMRRLPLGSGGTAPRSAAGHGGPPAAVPPVAMLPWPLRP